MTQSAYPMRVHELRSTASLTAYAGPYNHEYRTCALARRANTHLQ